jgi:hypothetical protein
MAERMMMKPMDKIDLTIYVIIALACAWDFWKASQYPSDVARRERFRAAGLLWWVSVLPAGVFLQDTLSLVGWLLLMALVTGGGALLFYWPDRKD